MDMAEKASTEHQCPSECPICLELYHVAERIPKVLPCDHTFCVGCLVKVQKVAKITCSTCRKEHDVVHVDDLHDNLEILLEMFWTFLPEKTSKMSCIAHLKKLDDGMKYMNRSTTNFSELKEKLTFGAETIARCVEAIKADISNSKKSIMAQLEEKESYINAQLNKLTLGTAQSKSTDEPKEECAESIGTRKIHKYIEVDYRTVNQPNAVIIGEAAYTGYDDDEPAILFSGFLGVAALHDSLIVVCGKTLFEFSVTGELMNSSPQPRSFRWPKSVANIPDTNKFVIVAGGGRYVAICDHKGKFIRNLLTCDTYGNLGISDVAVGPTGLIYLVKGPDIIVMKETGVLKGNIFVCDCENCRVVIFDPQGTLVHSFKVDTPYQKQRPSLVDIAVTKDNRIVVCDEANLRVLIY